MKFEYNYLQIEIINAHKLHFKKYYKLFLHLLLKTD